MEQLSVIKLSVQIQCSDNGYSFRCFLGKHVAKSLPCPDMKAAKLSAVNVKKQLTILKKMEKNRHRFSTGCPLV